MTFSVVWRPSAESALTELWLNTADRSAITAAADSIDALLRSSPFDVGESRSGITRILNVLPLSVYYDVFSDDMLVAVWAVWEVRKR